MKKDLKNKEKIKEKSIKNVLKPKLFDPFGSYTGISEDGSMPIQDADDL